MTEEDFDQPTSPQNQLQIMVKESDLPEEKSNVLIAKFANFFVDVQVWEKKAKAIKVTDESQKVMMDTARQGRLFIRKIRLNIEKCRKELKEQSLREGKAIDKVSNFLKDALEPIESHLDQQEHFVEYREAAKEAIVRAEIEKKMEEERLAEEKRKAEEEARLRKENEKLREEQTKIQAEADFKIKEAKTIAEKAERELREKRQAEMKAEADVIRKAEALKSASDIVKIQKLLEDLEAIKFPEVKAGESYRIVGDAMSHINMSILAIKRYIQLKQVNEEEL